MGWRFKQLHTLRTNEASVDSVLSSFQFSRSVEHDYWKNHTLTIWTIYIYLAWCKDLLKNQQPSIPMTSVNRRPWLSKIQLEPFTLLLCSVVFCI